MSNNPCRWRYLYLLTFVWLVANTLFASDGVFVRFKFSSTNGTNYYARLAGAIHNEPWWLVNAYLPTGAERDPAKRVPMGSFTPWFDIKANAAGRLHGRKWRAGGIAEFPNLTVEFRTGGTNIQTGEVVIELATAPDEQSVVKRFEETIPAGWTSVLVSPTLKADADLLETAAQMTDRHLRWAREATGGKRWSPTNLIVQTGFWGSQRPDLNLKESEVLWLLGFNMVGSQLPEAKQRFPFRSPGLLHVGYGQDVTPAVADAQMTKATAQYIKTPPEPGIPFNFSDEVVAPTIGTNAVRVAQFHAWLAEQKIRPKDLGVSKLEEVIPIETPYDLNRRQKDNGLTASRIFYYSCRFRQDATTRSFLSLQTAFHKDLGSGPMISTLFADHPYFSGTGLGMGMGPNPAWSSTPLAADWFDVARRKALDLAGIEDWMGLQYMYGSTYTWEGFQLMGFQAAIFRSGSRGEIPIIAWITPSDKKNLCLKTASALCQGAKNFFYWTYGPTSLSTENYWSDLPGEYDGLATVTRQLAQAEPILGPGRTRQTKVALLYSLSSDLFQTFDYVHMLERRLTYLALVHEQYLVDMLTEEDISSGRLKDYDVLYATDPAISESATEEIERWVADGGHLYASCGAGSRNEFNVPVPGLAKVLGIESRPTWKVQRGSYHIRGALNGMDYMDQIQLRAAGTTNPSSGTIGVIGVKMSFVPKKGAVVMGTFKDGSPAVIENVYHKGKATYVGACPGIAYAKEAHFFPSELKEKWPTGLREFITAPAREVGVPRLVTLSHPVVETGLYDAPDGTALVLANFTYERIPELKVSLRTPQAPVHVVSVERGELRFSTRSVPDNKQPTLPWVTEFVLDLDLSDIVMLQAR